MMNAREAMFACFGSAIAGFVLAFCVFGCSGSEIRPDAVATIAKLTPCVLSGVEKGLKGDDLVEHIARCGIEAIQMGNEATERAADAGTRKDKGS